MALPTSLPTRPVRIIFADIPGGLAVDETLVAATTYTEFCALLVGLSGSIATQIEGIDDNRVQKEGFDRSKGCWWCRIVKTNHCDDYGQALREPITSKGQWQIIDNSLAYDKLMAEQTLALTNSGGWIEAQHDLQKRRDEVKAKVAERDNTEWRQPLIAASHHQKDATISADSQIKDALHSTVASQDATGQHRAQEFESVLGDGPGPAIDSSHKYMRPFKEYVSPLVVHSPILPSMLAQRNGGTTIDADSDSTMNAPLMHGGNRLHLDTKFYPETHGYSIKRHKEGEREQGGLPSYTTRPRPFPAQIGTPPSPTSLGSAEFGQGDIDVYSDEIADARPQGNGYRQGSPMGSIQRGKRIEAEKGQEGKGPNQSYNDAPKNVVAFPNTPLACEDMESNTQPSLSDKYFVPATASGILYGFSSIPGNNHDYPRQHDHSRNQSSSYSGCTLQKTAFDARKAQSLYGPHTQICAPGPSHNQFQSQPPATTPRMAFVGMPRASSIPPQPQEVISTNSSRPVYDAALYDNTNAMKGPGIDLLRPPDFNNGQVYHQLCRTSHAQQEKMPCKQDDVEEMQNTSTQSPPSFHDRSALANVPRFSSSNGTLAPTYHTADAFNRMLIGLCSGVDPALDRNQPEAFPLQNSRRDLQTFDPRRQHLDKVTKQKKSRAVFYAPPRSKAPPMSGQFSPPKPRRSPRDAKRVLERYKEGEELPTANGDISSRTLEPDIDAASVKAPTDKQTRTTNTATSAAAASGDLDLDFAVSGRTGTGTIRKKKAKQAKHGMPRETDAVLHLDQFDKKQKEQANARAERARRRSSGKVAETDKANGKGENEYKAEQTEERKVEEHVGVREGRN